MSQISYPYTPVAGSVADPSGIESDLTAITGVVNGNLDDGNIAAGANIQPSKIAGTALTSANVTGSNGITVSQSGNSISLSTNATSINTPSTIIKRDGSGSFSSTNIILNGSISGAITVGTQSAAGTWTLTLPTSAGTSGYVLSTDGTGITSWIANGTGSGGMNNPMTTLGDIIFENSTPAAARLAGNTTITKKFLTQTGTGSVSASPSWSIIAAGDVPILNQNTTGSAGSFTGSLSGDVTGTQSATVLSKIAGTTLSITSLSTNQVLQYNGTDWINATLASGGSVTSVSVVSANGLAGTVATATTTPAITLSTTVTGMLKGNGTAISAGVSGTDYSAGTSALATGILKSTTSTGALSIAGSSDVTTALGYTPAHSGANSDITSLSGLTTPLSIGQGGTGSATQNFVDLTTNQSIAGTKTFSGEIIVPTPVNPTDSATKAYVDATAQGLSIKGSCRVATTGSNIILSGTQTIDGIALSVGDRILVKDQTTASANGIYVVASGSWSRSTDTSTSSDVTSGIFAFVSEGTVNGGSGWVLTTDNPITLGTTSLTFTQFSGAGEITAGTGLSKSGNTLSMSSSYIGQTSITTLGTIGTGTWHGGTIGTAYGGTGVASLSNLTVGSNLSISGGTAAIIGGNATISLGSNVVTSISNDTNITGSITLNALTLGWSGTLAIARGGTGSGTASGALTNLGALPIAGGTMTGTLTVKSVVNTIITATDGATVTFDLSAGNMQTVTIAGNRILAVSNVSVGQVFKLDIKQDATGSRTVTWFSGISWVGGSAPTLTATASKTDSFAFVCTASGTYQGYIIGQNI